MQQSERKKAYKKAKVVVRLSWLCRKYPLQKLQRL